MRKFNKYGWKAKIDPAFDKLVKVYVAFLDDLERSPKEGQLALPDDLAKLVSKKPTTHDLGDIEAHGDFFNYIRKTGGLQTKDFKTFFEVINSLEDYNKTLKTCFKLIKSLPEEDSRQFYTTKLNHFKDNPEFKPDTDILNKSNLDFYSIIISLLSRFLFAVLFEEEKEIINEEIDYFKNSNAITSFISVIQSNFSQLANQITLEELKNKIFEGDDKSIIKAVSIDKTILYLDEVKNRITEAQLTGDNKFLGKLGRAIASNPLKNPAQHGKTYSILKMFWFHGLYKLTNAELHDFLTSCGLVPPNSGYAFQQFVRRHIRSVYEF
jgi:predicted nucleic acid-binding protein